MTMNTQQTQLFPRGRAVVQAGPVESLPAVVTATPAPLSKAEARDLDLYELKIDESFQAAGREFRNIGAYLEEIRERRLYRAKFKTFEEYVRTRWQKSTRWALLQRQAAAVMKNLEGIDARPEVEDLQDQGLLADGPPRPINSREAEAIAEGLPANKFRNLLPSSESQVRPLAKLPPEEQREVWQEAVRSAPGGKVTAKLVEKAVGERKQNRQGPMADSREEGTKETEGSKGKAAILEASQRAVVGIRALEDLVEKEPELVRQCNAGVRAIEKIEERVRHGRPPATQAEAKWMIQDAAADLGGLEEMLGELEDPIGQAHARGALAALKPLYDKFGIANMKVERFAGLGGESRKTRGTEGTEGTGERAARREAA